MIWKRAAGVGLPYTSPFGGPPPFAALTTRTESKSASSSSATIVASPVWIPWPISIWLEYATTVPSSRIRMYGWTGSAISSGVSRRTSSSGGAASGAGSSPAASVPAASWMAARMRG